MRNDPTHTQGDRRVGTDAGFTLIEAIVTLVAFSFIMLVAFGLFTQLGRVALSNEQVGRSQAGARVAVEDLEKFLRSAGAEVDIARGQRNFVWAGPYQVAFNANISPANDPSGTLAPAALNAAAANAGVPNDATNIYFPPTSFVTGAETIVFTLDSNQNGVLDAGDKADDPEERSQNPNDYVLYRNVYGSDGGANVVDLSPIAVVRGPEQIDADDFVPPLFSYWVDDDDDRTTDPVLVGDSDGNGEIGPAEALALTPLAPRDLARIERVSIRVTSETATTNSKVEENGGYQRVEMNAEVKVRQVPRSSGVVYGMVYKDLNGNGVLDASESPISGVTVRASNGMTARSNSAGEYVLVVSPGTVTITEIDPNGYGSSTTNTLEVDAYPGSYTRLDFGDTPTSGVAGVTGRVFDDLNESRSDEGERGIANVKIYSDTGEYTYTQSDGSYWLDVPVGVRTISQVDSTGYVSTTPNAVEVTITDGGDPQTVNFGDTMMDETGTVEGIVFEDENRNGVQDNGEGGIPGATIVVGVNATESDTQGGFSITVPTGNYSVYEEDPPGYTSTTPNILHGVRVEADQVVTVNFGDVVRENLDFEVIELADTEKALSIAAGDFREDNRGDPDLVLGTRFSGGANNLLVWHNERRNSRTPNAAIFDTTPSLTRSNPADVTSLVAGYVDGDNEIDIITGLATTVESDLNVWISSGGNLPNSATLSYQTYNGQVVWDLQKVDINRDGNDDLIAAVQQSSSATGHAEIWWGLGNGEFSRNDANSYIKTTADGTFEPLGAVTSAQAADLNEDGWLDVVVASVDGTGISSVHVFLQRTFGSFTEWLPHQSFRVVGEITQIRLVDLVEDDQGDTDIVIASATSETTGHIEVWHNDFTGYFGLLSEAGRVMDDQMPTSGAPLSLIMTRLDNDIFPDVVAGVRKNNSYEGTVEYALGFGHLLSEAIPITDWSIGAVLTMTESDFNLDGVSDLAVGTQNSSSSGKIYIFFRQ